MIATLKQSTHHFHFNIQLIESELPPNLLLSPKFSGWHWQLLRLTHFDCGLVRICPLFPFWKTPIFIHHRVYAFCTTNTCPVPFVFSYDTIYCKCAFCVCVCVCECVRVLYVLAILVFGLEKRNYLIWIINSLLSLQPTHSIFLTCTKLLAFDFLYERFPSPCVWL